MGCTSQKTEAPVRERQGVESYEERKSEVDDVLTSPEANKDTELFGTEVGVADAMRFQGAAPELINSRYPFSCGVARSLVCTRRGSRSGISSALAFAAMYMYITSSLW